MKTTMMFRNIANPRRTTLAHLTDAEELGTVGIVGTEIPEHSVELPVIELPVQTANPRRTTLVDAPE
ncbi:hypothetical protein [Streptomyces sp. KR80]|uniref:hypothetical protein n=1 Tax=Streptomyces sp. KR80 TaxID=3457426 RepID=UPI003FCF78EA